MNDGKETPRPSIIEKLERRPGPRGSVPDAGSTRGSFGSLVGDAGQGARRSVVLTTLPRQARWLMAGATVVVAVVVGAAAVRDPASLDRLEAAAVQAKDAAAAAPTAKAPPHEAATAQEIQAAGARGVLALEDLAARYPQDPEVLKAILRVHTRPPPYYSALLSTSRRLLEIAPEAAADKEVQQSLLVAAGGPPEAASEALTLIAKQPGHHAPDLLYAIGTTQPALKEQAMKQLGAAAMLERATPALRVAYDLRVAPSCAARKLLLGRASEVGDPRAVEVLKPLLVSKSKGCGFMGLGRCPAPCAAISKEIEGAIQAIGARTGGR